MATAETEQAMGELSFGTMFDLLQPRDAQNYYAHKYSQCICSMFGCGNIGPAHLWPMSHNL